VVVNGRPLTPQELAAVGDGVPPGNYWYDSMSGLWGHAGGPTEGQVRAGLMIGGPLQADASNGDTGVFINGRQLPMIEVAWLRQLGPVSPGRAWLTGQGVYGLEGGPPLGQIVLSQQAPQHLSLSQRGMLMSPYDHLMTGDH
jgi:hypothetical protein